MRRSRSRTASSTAFPRRSSHATSTRPFARCATSTPASRTSTRARSARRFTSPSAAPRTRATATARRARPRSTSSRNGSRSTSTTPASCSAPRSTQPNRSLRLREGEDVEELDVEPGRRQACGLDDAILLLEEQHQFLAEILDGVELIETEADRGGLLAGREEQDALHVVRPAEISPFTESHLPLLARRDPILDSRGVDGQRFLDVDLDRGVVALGGRRARNDFENRHTGCISITCTIQT